MSVQAQLINPLAGPGTSFTSRAASPWSREAAHRADLRAHSATPATQAPPIASAASRAAALRTPGASGAVNATSVSPATRPNS